MNNINHKQNEEKILKYYFTQRTIYRKCKKITNITCIMSIFVYLFGVLPYTSQNLSNINLILSSAWIIALFILEYINGNIKKKAVDYQEYIDRTLFEFKIDKKIIPILSKLDNKANEIIICNRKKYQQAVDINYKYTVCNWYSDVSYLPLDIARVVCQNENIRWENRQRQLYTMILAGLVILLISLAGIKAYKYNESAINVLYVVPIIIEFIKMAINNVNVINAISKAEEIIDDLYLNIERKGNRYNKRNISQQSIVVQELIREYRLNNISVPEFIYKRMKIKEQHKSTDFISLKITEILNNI